MAMTRKGKAVAAQLRQIYMIVGAIVALGATACEKKSSEQKRGTNDAATGPAPVTEPVPDPDPAPVSAAVPVEIKDGLNLSRAYVQSRSPIVIDVSQQTLSPGELFSLTNDTTGATLVSDQTAGLRLSAYDLTLKLYPLDPEFASKFAYGVNQLHLLTKSEAEPKDARATFHRGDFALFVTAGGSFTKSGLERANGLELMPSGFGQPSVTNGTRVLTVDPISLLNR